MVWLLEGGTVPYVLRRTLVEDGSERFVFCGECYLQGAMHGELVEGDVQGRWEEVIMV